LNEKVASCRKNLQEAENAKRKVEENAANLQNKLSAAEKLVNGLAGENERWGKNIIDLRSNKRNVVGNSLLASSFVSYIGAFSSHLRLELWKMKWFPEIENQKIPMTPDIRPLRILSTDSL
jgi:dynein heavy chain